MPRLRLLAFLLLLGAGPKAAKPAESSPVETAKAFVKVSCAVSKDSCKETTKLLEDYLAVLNDALDCMSKPCEVAKINALYERDWKLDEREHLLPPRARSVLFKRPLLRLSLFVITAAGLALEAAAPGTAPPVAPNDAVESGKVVEQICSINSGDSCRKARVVVVRVNALNTGADACDKKPCDFPAQESLAIAAETALGSYFVFSGETIFNTSPIYGTLRGARARIGTLLTRTAESKLDELEANEKALTDDVAALEKNPGGANLGARIEALKAREAGALKLYRDASITSDRTLSLLSDGVDTSPLRGRINDSAARLASTRARLTALKTAQGFGGGPAAEGGVVGAARTGLAIAADAAAPLAVLGGLPPARPRSVGIDRRPVPMTLPANPSAPPILKAAPGVGELFRNATSTDALKQVDAMRRLGMTRTLGDPSGRAPLVHTQNASDTCAIVAQQQILMAHGLIEKGDPVKIEARLAKEAKDRGFYFDGQGTPRVYQADLLVDRGLIVTKKSPAPIEDLDGAVRRGGMVIASVDARHLWNMNTPDRLGHAIVITGAEIGKLDGKTLGYYINDSGAEENNAGRFVPIEQFKKAWDGHTKSFAEVR